MMEAYALAAVALLAAGAVAGFLALVSLGIHRDGNIKNPAADPSPADPGRQRRVRPDLRRDPQRQPLPAGLPAR